MGHILLHARQAPDGQAAGGLGGTIAPGIGGSAVASATAPVDDSGLAIDPDLANAPIPTVPVVTQATSPIVTSSEPDTPLSSGSSTDDAKSSSSKSNNTTTIVIVAVAAVAFLLIGIAILVLFYRSNKKKRRQSRRGHWREIESHQSHGGGQGAAPHMHHHDGSNYGHSQDQFQPHPEGGMFVETKSLYSTRRSVDAPPSLKLDFSSNEPFMSSNPFANPSPGSPVPPLPNMPQVQHVQQPQQIMVQHQVDPPSAGYSAPSEYTASYIRSVYSTTGDVQSIDSANDGTHSRPRSRSNTLKRGPDRTKNQHELIALDNLIAALDLTEEKKEQTLPDPSLFRAALGGQQQQQTPPQQHSQQPQQYY